ncbi:MAG: response regulator [candidate division NC10 bacterium]|nr:response regulator [candidate division NC10 bacterium]
MIRPECHFYLHVRHADGERETHTCLVRVHKNTVEPGTRTLPQVKTAIQVSAESGQDTPYGPLLLCDDKAPYCAFRPAEPVAATPLERPARERPLVLVVDDDKAILELLRDILATRRIDAVTATSGFEGLEVARDRRPDLVVLDVMMPGLDGYTTCAHLKKDPNLKGIPVLMFTAAAGAEFNERAFREGAAFCLAKPFEALRFLSLVEMALRRLQVLPSPRPDGERRQRASPRYVARYAVTAQATGGTAKRREVAGFTGNISTGGLLCILPERFPVTTPLLLRVETPAGPVALTATVAWCGSSSARRPGDVPHGLRIVQACTPEDGARWTQTVRAVQGGAVVPEPKR